MIQLETVLFALTFFFLGFSAGITVAARSLKRK